MNVALELPEEVAQRLQSRWGDVPRRALEAIALDGYRSGALTPHQIRLLLNFSTRWEVEEFLSRERAYLHYDQSDLHDDQSTLAPAREAAQR